MHWHEFLKPANKANILSLTGGLFRGSFGSFNKKEKSINF